MLEEIRDPKWQNIITIAIDEVSVRPFTIAISKASHGEARGFSLFRRKQLQLD